MNYVRVVAYLYSNVWKQYCNRGKRFMLDPTVADQALKDQEVNVSAYTKHITGTRAQDINVIFVPVLLRDHWWCAAFSNNMKKVVVIDSLEIQIAASVHNNDLIKLCHVMNNVFQHIDSSSTIDTCTWECISLRMDKQIDEVSCGVHMLAAIKLCAHQFQESVLLGPIKDVRKMLFAEDVLSKCNEARGELKKMLEENIVEAKMARGKVKKMLEENMVKAKKKAKGEVIKM